jgi:dUTP pyrophosphatase
MSQNPVLQVLLTNPDARVPSKANADDSCFDFFAAEDVRIRPGETRLVDLGCRLIIPEGYDLVLREKSGLASRGIIIGAGEVDQGYRGPLKAVVRYMSYEDPAPMSGSSIPDVYEFRAGQKVCQGRLVRKINTDLQEITEDQFSTDTERGEGGFGSSGT